MKVRSRGFEIHYKAAGGPGRRVLLLVHGILQSSARWADMGYLDAFADDYRVVAVDLLGHGESDKPHDPASYVAEGQVADLLAVLDAEHAMACDVWAYSGGAALAAALATEQRDRVGGVVLGGIPPNIPLEARGAVFGAWIDALRDGDWDRFWASFLPIDPATRVLLQQSNDPRAVAAWMEGTAESAGVVTARTAPTLIYMGENEVFFDAARATADAIGAEFTAIEGRDHAGAFQDLVAIGPVVSDFLRRARRVQASGAAVRPGTRY